MGSPNKYAYSESFGASQFKMVLPEGISFPYDFGMVPPSGDAWLRESKRRDLRRPRPSPKSQRRKPASSPAYGTTMSSLIRDASASITNGLVSTAMPGSRCPFPTTAFSA